MTKLTAADRSQIYTELTEATSARTAEVLMQRIGEVEWDQLVTKDDLDARFTTFGAQMDAHFANVDARFAQMDTRTERGLRNQTIWLISTIFAFNGLLATWFTILH